MSLLLITIMGQLLGVITFRYTIASNVCKMEWETKDRARERERERCPNKWLIILKRVELLRLAKRGGGNPSR